MSATDQVNILLVDDQPAKLLSYEVILQGLGENLIKAASAREALEWLLKTEIAVVLVDVSMPDLDGFQLATMIREHPRFERTAIIFVSAIHLTDLDQLRGYENGAVDYVPVPVVAEVLRAKVKVFSELYRKTRQIELLNAELEQRVADRTLELEASTARLIQSERSRSLALAISNMGSWDWDGASGKLSCDEGQCRILGVAFKTLTPNAERIRSFIYPPDLPHLQDGLERLQADGHLNEIEFRVRRPDGEIRWCRGTAVAAKGASGKVVQVNGVTVDITERKKAEERQALLAREVDHRAKNTLAVVQSILRLTRATDINSYIRSLEGRLKALSGIHAILSESRWEGADFSRLVHEELAPYQTENPERITAHGPTLLLEPSAAQTFALVLHELATNAAKYGALSTPTGTIKIEWKLEENCFELRWAENGGPQTSTPNSSGFGTRIIVGTIEQQLGGSVQFDWNTKGLVCFFRVPHHTRSNSGEKRPRQVVHESKTLSSKLQLQGNRVLLVEDEVIVGMAVGDWMTELGYVVMGPFATLGQAFAAVVNRDVDAAILDVNLGGEMVYPLAELLVQRRVPFIFITGYGADAIDPRFADVPTLTKPIERNTLPRIFGQAQAAQII